jgi:hypothetical protein
MEKPNYILITEDDGFFYGNTVKEVVDEAEEYIPNIKVKLKLKQVTIHKIGISLGWLTIHRETTPKARCINPPPEKQPVVETKSKVLDDFIDW